MRSNSCSSIATNIPPTEVLHTIVNQEHILDDENYSGTALHYAVGENNLQAVRLLLEHGAIIDKADSKGRTGLLKSLDEEMTKLLVHHGTSLVDHFQHDIFDSLTWDVDVFTAMISAYSRTTSHHPLGTIPAFLSTIHDTRGTIECTEVELLPVHLVSIMEADIDLNRDLGSGRSIMHLAIVNKSSSTFVLNNDLSLEDTAPFPWHLAFWSSLSFLGSMFRHFKRKLKDEDFVRIAHLQPARGLSPLCWAASWEEETIRNCLSLGADVDFEGSPHGSALILACAIGSLEAVRILVQAGASLSYQGRHGHKNVFTFCRSKDVRRWLLVERFTEQRRIDTRPQWRNSEGLRPWAGTAMARLKLVGDRAMCYHETLMDYAGRLARMRMEWRGKVIPPICIDGFVYGS